MSFYYRPGDLGIFLIHGHEWDGPLHKLAYFCNSNFCNYSLDSRKYWSTFHEADETFKSKSLILTQIKLKILEIHYIGVK